jgi:MscS family membrane protein
MAGPQRSILRGRRGHRSVSILVALGAIASCVFVAALRADPQLPGPAGSAPPAETETARDPYGRETPRGAFFGFLRAAGSGRYAIAAEYLRIPQPFLMQREQIAREFQSVLDHRFVNPRVDQISNAREGTVNEGLAAGLESVGSILGERGRFDVLLVRQQPREGPPIWMFSWDTVWEARQLYERGRFPRLERILPPILQETRIGGIAVWQMAAFFLFLPVLYGVSWLVIVGFLWVLRRLRRTPVVPGARDRAGAARIPATVILTLFLHRFVMAWLGVPVLYRVYYSRVLNVLLFVGLLWLLFRLIDVIDAHLLRRIMPYGHPAGRPTLTLARGALRFLAFVIVALIALSAFGINVTATIAGLGIGGLVLAFAAQKSLENVFGGLAILANRAVRVGDTCRIAGQLGEIEDITLWATRLRTMERVVVSIPNGTVANGVIENLSRRDKFWFHPTLGLAYETTPAQMRQVLEEIRALLDADPRVDSEDARSRFARLNASSLDIDVSAYVRATTNPEFLAVQEDLLLRILDVVEKAGTSVAFPSQTVYVRGTSSASAASENRAATPPPTSPGVRIP